MATMPRPFWERKVFHNNTKHFFSSSLQKPLVRCPSRKINHEHSQYGSVEPLSALAVRNHSPSNHMRLGEFARQGLARGCPDGSAEKKSHGPCAHRKAVASFECQQAQREYCQKKKR